MINDWKIKKSDFFFFIAYIVFLFYKIINTSTYGEIIGESIMEKIKFFSWFLLIVKILLCNKINIKLIVGYAFLIGLGIVIRINSGSSEILELMLVILAANDIEFKNIAKVTLAETIILCAIIIISSLIGIIPNYLFLRSNGQYAMALGFSYVSKLSNYILAIIFLSLYISESEKKLVSNIKLLLYFVISTVVFIITYVRNPYIISLMLLFAYVLIVKYKKINLKKYKRILSCMFIICFFIIFLLINNFDAENSIYNTIDKLLNSRLSTMNRVYNTYGASEFGVKFKMVNGINENYTYVDSGYISLLMRDGYIILILIGISYTCLLRYNIDNDNKVLTIWLLLIAIESIADDALLQINFNCAILTLFGSIKTNMIKNKKKEEKINESSSSYCNI